MQILELNKLEITASEAKNWEEGILVQIKLLRDKSQNRPLVVIMTDWQFNAILHLSDKYSTNYKPNQFYGADVMLLNHQFHKNFKPMVYVKGEI